MLGALLQLAKSDAAFIASQGGFQVDVILSTKDDTTSLPVTGLATGTWMVFDDDQRGKSTNSTSDSFTVAESQLIAANYPYKQNGRPNLIGHKVVLNDGASMSGNFVISEIHPNATLGLIVCILSKSSL